MQKQLLYCILSFILCFKTAESQNLIPNPSFEEHYECQMAMQFLKDWYAPDASSPDYFNACAPYSSWMSVPLNTRGYQAARTGAAYIFFGTSLMYSYKYREHFAVQLLTPLIGNRKYIVKFYVSLAETGGWAMDDIGAYFSAGRIDTTGMGTYITNVTPQVKNPRGNIIIDTLDWLRISGSFIANGGEDNITIGSFMYLDSIAYRIAYSYPVDWAGYFVDDVSVYECNNPDYPAEAGNNKKICPGDSVQLGTTNYEYYTYRWHPKTGLSDTTSGTPLVKPLVTTTYYLQQTNFFDTLTTDSVTIYVNDCSGAEAGGNRALCKGKSTKIGSNDYGYNRYSWHPAAGLSDTTSGTPWASPQVTTMYYLTQYNLQDSVSRDSVLVKVIDCDSVNNNVITIYPNPSQGEFYIEFSEYVPEDARFTISNTLGQVLIKSEITREERKKLVNTGFLASGVYFVRVYEGENLMRSEKIVKVNSE